MKAIMISDNPRYCVLIMNGDKTIEVRKNKALASAIQKLIDENGYADIYVYCCKNGVDINGIPTELVDYRGCAIYNRFQLMRKGAKLTSDDEQPRLNGKVLFKFRCYKVEDIIFNGYFHPNDDEYTTNTMNGKELMKASCLDLNHLVNYLEGTLKKRNVGYAIHISDLKIFDKPKELNEFKIKRKINECSGCKYLDTNTYEHCIKCEETRPLTKAPQNMIYIEVENNE